MSADSQWVKPSLNKFDRHFVSMATASSSSSAQFELSLNTQRALEKQVRDLECIKKTKKEQLSKYREIRNSTLSLHACNMQLKENRNKVRAILSDNEEPTHEQLLAIYELSQEIEYLQHVAAYSTDSSSYKNKITALQLEIEKIAVAITLIQISLQMVRNSQEKTRVDVSKILSHELVTGIFDRSNKIKVAEEFIKKFIHESEKEKAALLTKKGKREAVSLRQSEVDALLREDEELEKQENREGMMQQYSALSSSMFKAATCRKEEKDAALLISLHHGM